MPDAIRSTISSGNHLRVFSVYISLLISRVRPVHSFFEKKSIRENPSQIFTNLYLRLTKKRLTQKGWSLFYIGCRRVVGRLRQSSASLHPPSGTSFLREPLTRPRPATLCRSLPATTQLTSLPVFQQQVPYFESACAWTLLYKQHTS